MHIIVIDDEKILWKSIETSLKKNGYEVTIIKSYNDFLSNNDVVKADLFLIDISLGDGSGFDIIKQLKDDSITMNIPSIFISGHSDTKTIVEWLDLGWDDYMVKPFHSDELLARIRKCLRHKEIRLIKNTLSFENIRFDTSKRQVFWEDGEIILSRKEKQILELFLKNPEVCISKQELEDKFWLWSSDFSVTDNTINVTICNLRKKLWPTFKLETIIWEWYCLHKNA